MFMHETHFVCAYVFWHVTPTLTHAHKSQITPTLATLAADCTLPAAYRHLALVLHVRLVADDEPHDLLWVGRETIHVLGTASE